MRNTNPRGLIFANEGSVATFGRPGCEDTIADINMVSESMYHRVLEIYTGSDHQYITYTFALDNGIEDNYTTSSRTWDARKLNANRLISEVDKLYSRVKLSDDARTRVKQTMEIIRRGCNKAIQGYIYKATGTKVHKSHTRRTSCWRNGGK